MTLRVLSVAAACATVVFTWGALVSRSSSTAAIAEAAVALEGVANYLKVNIKNKTNRPASGKKTTQTPAEGLVATTTSRFDVVSSSSFSSVSILNGSDPQATRKVRPVMITNVAHSSYPSLYLLWWLTLRLLTHNSNLFPLFLNNRPVRWNPKMQIIVNRNKRRSPGWGVKSSHCRRILMAIWKRLYP